MSKKTFSATVLPIPAHITYAIWAYGIVLYESMTGLPLGPYACRGKRAMSSTEVCKIGLWDETSVRKALRHVPDNHVARDLLKRLLHHDPTKRISTMRHVLEHPFFSHGSVGGSSGNGNTQSPANTFTSSPSANSRSSNQRNRPSGQSHGSHHVVNGFNSFSDPPDIKLTDSSESSLENRENGVPKRTRTSNGTNSTGRSSIESAKSAKGFGGFRKLRTLRKQTNQI
jgi:serine/threonine protein kinase